MKRDPCTCTPCGHACRIRLVRRLAMHQRVVYWVLLALVSDDHGFGKRRVSPKVLPLMCYLNHGATADVFTYFVKHSISIYHVCLFNSQPSRVQGSCHGNHLSILDIFFFQALLSFVSFSSPSPHHSRLSIFADRTFMTIAAGPMPALSLIAGWFYFSCGISVCFGHITDAR